MAARIFAALLALDLALLVLTWGVRALAGQPETLTQALEFWRCLDSRHYLDIARDYEAAGADCISCLTEPKWFLGSDDIFREIRTAVSTPMLRKDFTVSDYQLYQSRLMGADCVLLICALLDTKALAQYLAVCDELGLSALVETHDADEIRSAIAAGAKIIGVNSLGYLSIEDVVKLADNTENGFCTACFGGGYPTSIPKDGGKDRFECKISEGEKKKNA